MRARVYSNGGISTGGFTFNGGQLTGALILAGNPSDPLEAAAKQYVDSSLVNLNASNLTSGILPAGRLPVFTGDIVKPAGSSSINIAPIGITAGDYVKPTVDAKGRVTAGGVITEADLPNISWNKVSTGKPTTVEGYGITGALTTAGGTLSGFLTFNGSITGTMQAVTKQYVDVTLSSSAGIAIGDIIRKPYGTTPAGFLKCNGALVDKTTYNALYATIGDRFSKQQRYTSGCPWQQQYNINETQSTDITGWTTYTNLPAPMYTLKSIVTKNRVYIIGGANNTIGALSTIYTAPINADGSLGAWVASGNLPGVLGHSSIVVTKNRIHLLGGWVTNVVYTASINNDGTLGAWTTGISLPIAARDASVIVTNNRVYFLGGGNTTDTFSTIYSAFINSDGTLGTWIASGNLPINLAGSQVVITKNRAYLCGGSNATGVLSSVYTAPINSDGTLGTWTTSLSLPGQLASSQAIVTKNRVYLCGGTNSSSYTNVVYTAPINQDGTLGTWSIGTPIPGALGVSSTVITKNHVYLIGGYTTEAVSTVYSAIISGGLNDYSSYYAEDTTNYMMPGSGKPWEQQYQINNSQQSPDITGWVSGTAMPGITAQASVIVTKNRVYVIGGRNASVYLNTVYTAPINSDGTLGTWVTDTPFPVNIASAQVFVTKNKAYLVGGFNGTTYSKTIYTAVINADGTLGTWNASSIDTTVPLSGSGSLTLPIGTTSMSATGKGGSGVTNPPTWTLIDGSSSDTLTGYPPPSSISSSGGTLILVSYDYNQAVYRRSGSSYGSIYKYQPGSTTTGTASTFTVNGTTYTFPGGVGGAATQTTNNATFPGTATIPVSYNIAAGGSGSITYTVGNSLPYSVAASQAVVTRDRVYLLGGYINGAYSSATYHATIDSNGVIGTWVAGLNLPVACAYSQAVITKNRIYLLGGTPNGSSATSTIYVSTISNDGIIGPWTTASPSLPGAVFGGQMFVSKNTVYLISGTNGSSNVTTIYYAQINSDGIIGTWMTGATLPFSGYHHSVFVTSSKIYSVGGVISSAYSAAVWSAPILGGINDYSPYYDGTITHAVIVDPTTTFALPDLTNSEKFDTVSYIKY